MRLVLASNNAKKLTELQTLFAHLAVDLVPQRALGIAEADEPHVTFVENALAKARHAAQACGGAALADDSGLCVDALDGAPGVQSAHFASLALPADGAVDREARRRLQDRANNDLLLQRLCGCTERSARFVATLVAVRRVDDPEPLIAFGRWEGRILEAPQGEGGFGYDPLMFIAALGCSVAAVSAEVKGRLSHRAMAARDMVAMMREVWRVD